MNKGIKAQYNALLIRQKDGEKYLDSQEFQALADVRQIKIINAYVKICEDLGILLGKIENYTHDEAINGFIERDGLE